VFSHMGHAGVLAQVLDDNLGDVSFETPLEVGGIVQHRLRQDGLVGPQGRGLYDAEELFQFF